MLLLPVDDRMRYEDTHARVQQCAISSHAACGKQQAAYCNSFFLQLICGCQLKQRQHFYLFTRILLSSDAKSDTLYLPLATLDAAKSDREIGEFLEFLINVDVSQ